MTFLTDPNGAVKASYGISGFGRGYFVINKLRQATFKHITSGGLLPNQTATLINEIDKMLSSSN